MLALPDHPFTLADLGDMGLTPWRLRTLMGTGAVRRVARGVFVDASVPDSIEVRAAAVDRVVGPGHVAVDRTAAWLHGIDVLTWEETELLPPVETCVLPGRHPTGREDVDGRVRDLRADDVMTLGPVTVTTPLRTALDLGCCLRRREAMAALNEFARRHGVGAESLVRELPRYAGRRGVVQLRELVPLVTGEIESPRESWIWEAIHASGLPLPTPQLWIDVDGEPTYRLDFAYPTLRVAVEYDGQELHSTPEQVAHDEERRTWLRAGGWTVIVVGRGDFGPRALDRWLTQLRDALRPTYSPRRW
jgi:hypothetical protein